MGIANPQASAASSLSQDNSFVCKMFTYLRVLSTVLCVYAGHNPMRAFSGVRACTLYVHGNNLGEPIKRQGHILLCRYRYMAHGHLLKYVHT